MVSKDIEYPYNQCKFKATQKGCLEGHKGIKYPCNQLDYKATQKII